MFYSLLMSHSVRQRGQRMAASCLSA